MAARDRRVAPRPTPRGPHVPRRGTGKRRDGRGGGRELVRRLEGELLSGAGARDGLASVSRQAETFRWRDGINGAARAYRPPLLATREDGSRVYVAVLTERSLERNPLLEGRRARIELECACRGADFEIWTEREILEGRSGDRLIRPATGPERVAYAKWRSSAGYHIQPFPALADFPFARLAADAFKMDGLLPHGEGWLGRNGSTGIVMAIFCDLRVGTRSRLLRWGRD